jgi:DNA invertase Pin-like site-specific DNA recombinase
LSRRSGQRQRLQAIGTLRIFEDVVSGKTFQRPGLAELLDYIRPGNTLAVVRLDRLGRSLRDLLDVVETLKKRGGALLSLEEKIDTSSAAGELVFHVFGAIAQFERRLIAERTRDGMNAARAKGKKPGRPALDHDKLNAAAREKRPHANPGRKTNRPRPINRLSRNPSPLGSLSR